MPRTLTADYLPDAKDRISSKEAASIIGRSEDWLCITRKKKSSECPPHYLIGGRFIYLRSEVIEWFNGRRNLTREIS